MTLKQTEVFSSLFREEQLNFPASWESMVTDSTIPPFSDRYMMGQVQYSTTAAIAFYGTALSTSIRRDLATHYTRLMAEVMKYAEDCGNVMIKNGWAEEPPKAVDRKALSRK